MKTVNELIKDINSLTSHLHEKILLTWEQTPDELKQVLDVAAALKHCVLKTSQPKSLIVD